MNKQERKAELARLMEMTPPTWLTKEKYQKFLDDRDTLKSKFKIFNALGEFLTEDELEVLDIDTAWGSVNGALSPKFLYDKYINQELISDPTTGQDPKMYSTKNLQTASKHAGNQWGWKCRINPNTNVITTPSAWINFGTFNIVKIDGKLCISPINVEHRLWGLLGFPLNLVQLQSKKTLWYYHKDLPEVYNAELGKMVNGIKVNDMYLSDIVKRCNDLGVDSITESTIKNRFWKNKFKFSFLPMYSQPQTEAYFAEINDASNKSDAQMFHAEPHPLQYWIKDFSSVKVSKFTPADKQLHPIFETMAQKKLVQLESLMITHTVLQFIFKNGYIAKSDKSLINLFRDNKNKISEEIKDKTIESLDWLDSVLSKSEFPLAVTKSLAIHFLKIRNYLDESNKLIADKALFMDEWNKYFTSKGENANNKNVTEFMRYWRTDSVESHKGVWKILLDEFINKGEEIGIVTKSPSVPRLFTADVTYDSYIENNKLDVDGKLLTTKPAAGHRISDMELIRMTPEQRTQAFIDEGLGDTFDFNKNCRAMSKYHNLRMGVLRLSEYLPIIDNDKEVRKLRIKKYNELKQKEILI